MKKKMEAYYLGFRVRGQGLGLRVTGHGRSSQNVQAAYTEALRRSSDVPHASS